MTKDQRMLCYNITLDAVILTYLGQPIYMYKAHAQVKLPLSNQLTVFVL